MKEFKNITKKEAIAILENKSNFLIASIWKCLELVKNKIIENYEDINNNIDDKDFRKCIKKHSNALQFDNLSWLYFTGFKKAYLFGEWLILTSEDNTLIYKIK